MSTDTTPLGATIKRHSRSLFMLAMLSYTILLIYTALSYSREARLFPLIATVLLVGLITIESLLKRYGDKINIGATSVFSHSSDDPAGAADTDGSRNTRRELEMVGWIAGFIFAIWLFGFLASFLLVPLFVYVYKRDVRIAVYTLLAVVGLYYVFVLVLSARLWDGIVIDLLQSLL
ncbi:tripartite tricarboxylate transporter TctB family protein [Haloferax sp. DFSO52]|uniref:tripartite tricarboxylate transporter TctB family protein n=1 Tax=Haloferax sp. DFSO52 TaxID=3388505 RepID=UPI003A863E19